MKEFAFTKRISCGLCNLGITPCEKYKKLKDGTTNRYVYYGCCRGRDLNCKEGYIREEALINRLVNIIDQIDINEIGIKHKFEEEVGRFNKFQRNFLETANGEKAEAKKIDLKMYVKYILQEGSTIEKRELLACIKSRLVFMKKGLTLEK